MCILIYIIYGIVAIQIVRLIKFEIGHHKRIKPLRKQWVEICKKAEKDTLK